MKETTTPTGIESLLRDLHRELDAASNGKIVNTISEKADDSSSESLLHYFRIQGLLYQLGSLVSDQNIFSAIPEKNAVLILWLIRRSLALPLNCKFVCCHALALDIMRELGAVLKTLTDDLDSQSSQLCNLLGSTAAICTYQGVNSGVFKPVQDDTIAYLVSCGIVKGLRDLFSIWDRPPSGKGVVPICSPIVEGLALLEIF